MGGFPQRVLFISPFEPWCRENGSSVVIADLLEGLSSLDAARILPIFLRHPPQECTPAKPAPFDGVTLGLEPLPKWFSVIGPIVSGKSPWKMRLPNRKVAEMIARKAKDADFSPTVIHVEHLVLVEIGLHLARIFDCPLVHRAHNVESLLWRRRLGALGRLAKGLLRRLERQEAESIAKCQMTLCISDVDLAWVRSESPNAPAMVLPVGLAFDRFKRFDSKTSQPKNQVCFVGGLEWQPNEVGLRWFVDEVLPLIVAQRNDVKLAVLARGASTRPWLTDNPNVQVLPQTYESLSLFAASRVSVAPLLEGGGVRVKILESLAVGCPVVATTIGGEGLSLPGLTHTNDPPTFAAACIKHLRDESAIESRQAVRNAVRGKHGADVVARDLVESWRLVSRSKANDG